MKIIELHLKITKIMKISEFHKRMKKIIKILEVNERHKKIIKNNIESQAIIMKIKKIIEFQ